MKEKNIIHIAILLLLIIISQFGRILNLYAQTSTLDGRGGGIIAFTSDRDGQNEIYFMNADGSSQTRITNTMVDEYFPKWSNDGSKLAFRKEGGIYVINILDLPNGVVSEPQLVIEIDGASLDWTPNGWIIFDSPAAGNWDIYIVRLNGDSLKNITNKTWVTNSPWLDEFPSWSPDGLKITYENDTNNKEKIYTINIDGTEPTQLTNTNFNDGGPDWNPVSNPPSVSGFQKNSIPQGFRLFQNYPNPFNPSTKIKYVLHKPGNVILKIFNLSGQELETLFNGFQPAGEHEITWHPKELSTGIYFYRLQVGKFSETRKFILQN